MLGRKKLLLPAILLSLVFFGFGCKGLSQEQQQAIKPIQINYWTVFGDITELSRLAKAYKVERPYVTVNIRQIRYEEFDKLFTNALADEVAPDVISMHTRWLHKYTNRLSPMPANVSVANITVKEGLQKQTIVTPVNVPLPTPRAIASNFVKTVPSDVIVDGSVYGLPLSVDTLALYYNKDLLDKAGVALPPTTWAEFLDAVKKSTKLDANGNIVQAGVPMGLGVNIDNSADIVAMLMMQNGLQMSKDKSIMFADGLNDNPETHPAREALRFYTDFARPTKEAYSWNDKMGNALDAFISGRSVFYIGFAYDLATIKGRAPQMNLEVIPVPQLNSAAPVNVANYWVESVVKKSANQDEAWDFIRFITTPDNIAAYTKATSRPSPLRAQLQSQKDDPALAPFAEGLLTADNWYRGQNPDAAAAAMKDLITRFLIPYGENESPVERDANLISNAAALVQQTM